jgi:hypothetical protein
MFSLGDSKQHRQVLHLRNLRLGLPSNKLKFTIFPDVPEQCPRNPSGPYWHWAPTLAPSEVFARAARDISKLHTGINFRSSSPFSRVVCVTQH